MKTTRHKAVAAAVSAVLTVAAAALLDQVVTIPEWGEIAGALAVGALGVYAVWRVPNEPTVSPRQSRPGTPPE